MMIKKRHLTIGVRCWQHSHVCYQLYLTIRTGVFLLAFASTYSHCRALVQLSIHCERDVCKYPLYQAKRGFRELLGT